MQTSTEHHKRLGVGWVFPGPPAAGPQDAVEFACIPFLASPGGALQPMFEVQADQRRQFTQLADSHPLDARGSSSGPTASTTQPGKPASVPARRRATRTVSRGPPAGWRSVGQIQSAHHPQR